MLVFYLLSICVVISAIMPVEDGVSVRITTIPSQGPFRLKQIVQFFCVVEYTQSGNVVYQWRGVEYVDAIFSFNSYQGSFNKTYYPDNLRYCWYFCTVRLNGKVLGSAQKLVEVHGLLQTDEPIARAFSLHERMVMRINVFDYYSRAQYIGSLAWYHNGTKLTSDDRFVIANNGISLTISNMVESDAGKYEVRINSIYPPSNSYTCDTNILPLLEHLSLYAPVTFLLQKLNLPTYNPENIIVDYTVPAYQCTPQRSITINNTIMFNAAAKIDVTQITDYQQRNGVLITDRSIYNSTVSYDNITTQSLRITYNNTGDIAGHYSHQAYAPYISLLEKICSHYTGYIYANRFPIFIMYWNIRSSNTPVLHMRQEKLVLSAREVNTIECDIINCISANMSLWHNRKMLVQINGTYIQHQFKTSLFGVFICQADNVSNSSLVQEKAQIQLLLEANGSTCCGTAMDLQMSVAALLKTLCEECNIDMDNLEKTRLNYSTSGRSAYFTADLIYSNSEGTVTSSTLIAQLWSWLLTEEAPNINISGYSVALNKKCPIPANLLTKDACVNQLHSSDIATTTKIRPVFVGLITGIFLGAIVAISILLLLFCLCRRRCKSKTVENDKNSELDDMSINLAYGIEPHYMEPTPMTPMTPMGKDLVEHIYEYPVHDNIQ